MAYGSSLGITLPTVGVSTGPGWATSLNTALTTIIATLEAKVTPSGMDINADLSFTSGATAYRAKDVKALSLSNQASSLAAATYACTLFSSDADGELYWNDNNGRQVQLTTDGSVNVSTTGGITGSGYGASSVEVNWDAANTQYKMRSGAGADDYASVMLNDVKLNDGSSHTLTVAAPSMSADYTLTLPAAVPAANGTLLQVATTGAVTAASTSLTDMTLASGSHITLAGTGQYKHGDRKLFFPASLGQADDDDAWSFECTTPTQPARWECSASGDAVSIPLVGLPVGVRIKEVRFHITEPGSGSGMQLRLLRYSKTAASGTNVGDTMVSSAGGADAEVALTGLGSGHTVLDDYFYHAYFLTNDAVLQKVHGVEVVYDNA